MTARYLSERPARFFGLWPRKGALVPGADADITILEPSEFTYPSATMDNGLGWSPYDGERLAARAAATFVRGTLVWDGQKITARLATGVI
jgi:allantoinase